ncbi:MAG TPA: hypothetical protein VLS48_05950 [Anaerolineales bacterium]|nr:hypothetical protein [Anaerolineales bacterium]
MSLSFMLPASASIWDEMEREPFLCSQPVARLASRYMRPLPAASLR